MRTGVLVGCNYPSTPFALQGCINDVATIKDTLLKRFGFEENHIQVLTDDQTDENMKPTGANIKKALEEMVKNSVAGDVLVFHYSGHGTVRDNSEAIVPTDMDLIPDRYLGDLVKLVAKGAIFTMLSDSCFSGGLIDQEKEQIGPHVPYPPNKDKTVITYTSKSKLIPYESIVEYLMDPQTQLNTSQLLQSYAAIFDEEPSALKKKKEVDELQDDRGILLSGCQADELSADVQQSGEKAYGAFTHAVEMVLKENSGPLTYKQLVIKVREFLEAGNYQQHPCLYCGEYDNSNNHILGW